MLHACCAFVTLPTLIFYVCNWSSFTAAAVSFSDVPTKQFILSLDKRLACVVSDLDATHVFVKKDSIKEIQ